jgi:hypothetical protein
MIMKDQISTQEIKNIVPSLGSIIISNWQCIKLPVKWIENGATS